MEQCLEAINSSESLLVSYPNTIDPSLSPASLPPVLRDRSILTAAVANLSDSRNVIVKIMEDVVLRQKDMEKRDYYFVSKYTVVSVVLCVITCIGMR